MPKSPFTDDMFEFEYHSGVGMHPSRKYQNRFAPEPFGIQELQVRREPIPEEVDNRRTCTDGHTKYPRETDLPYPPGYNPTEWVKEVVGQKYKAWNGQTYLCFSYDPRIGFWMQNIEDEGDFRNVSERAIDRTYHKVYR